MVQKLLELELKAGAQGPRASALLLELGDVLCDLGEWEKATAADARRLGASGGGNAEASARLADGQLEAKTWRDGLAELLQSANETSDPGAKGRVLLRAAHVARRFVPAEAEGILARAYLADPANKQVSALYETLLSDQGRFGVLEQAQRQIVQAVVARRGSGSLARAFGMRWVLRDQNLEVGTRFLEEALRLDPDNEGAFFFLREAYGKKAGDWDRVLTLAEEAATSVVDDMNATFLLAQAGTIAWRELGNLIRARLWFERLSAGAPEHPQLRAFEAQIGETLKPSRAARKEDGVDGLAVRQASVPAPATRPAVTPTSSNVASSVTPTVAQPAPVAPPPAAATGNDAKIVEIRQQGDKQEAAKRYNGYVQTLLQLASLVPDPDEKVSLYTKAAELYVSKFANQAEAVKAYEAVLAVNPDHAQAIEYLRQMYEKRRDWEKLLGLQRREAERLPPGGARAVKFLEIAKLATERVKKPEVCIDLWQEVLSNDEANTDALGALAGLYERAKDFEKLAAVLRQQADVTVDAAAKIQVMTKLVTIFCER